MVTLNQSKSLNFGPIFIALAAFLWATDSFVRGRFNTTFTSSQVVFLEHLIILLVISPLVLKHLPHMKNFNRKEWAAILFIGIGGSALATTFFTHALFIDAGFDVSRGKFILPYIAIIVFIQQVQPFFAVGFAHLLLKERLPRFYYIFAIISIVGVLLIALPEIYNAEISLIENFRTNNGIKAAIFALGAAFFWGTSTVMGRYILEYGELKPTYVQITTYRFTIAGIFLVIFLPIADVFSINTGGYPAIDTIFDGDTPLYLLYVALVVGLLSLVLYYYGLRTTDASVSAIFELAFPITFYVIMPLFDVEYPEPIQILGSIILVLSSTLLSYNYAKLPSQQSAKHVTS